VFNPIPARITCILLLGLPCSPHVSGAVVLATEWWLTFNAGANPHATMARRCWSTARWI
jgi:hypothetical protein